MQKTQHTLKQYTLLCGFQGGEGEPVYGQSLRSVPTPTLHK